MKRIKIKTYRFPTKFGFYIAENVEVLVYDNEVTSKNFNPKKHEHAVSANGALDIERQAALSFLDSKFRDIRLGEDSLTGDEFAGIMLVCDVKAVQFAMLLGVSKGQVSKLIRSATVPKSAAIPATDLLIFELKLPGFCKMLLSNTSSDNGKVKASLIRQMIEVA